MATYGLKSITVGSNTYEMNTKNALSISLNGGSLSFDGSTANQSVSFYAPIAAGSSGKVIGWDATNSRPAWIDAPNGGLQNLVDGSAAGSVRGISTSAETSSYTMGVTAVAEGMLTLASGYASHAEGAYSHAVGAQSHAEGNDTYARGNSSHSEGIETNAYGDASHAEGQYSYATGNYSHASGLGTNAFGRSTFVIGEYNGFNPDADPSQRGDFSFVIGGGDDNSDRWDIFSVDWAGNIYTAGTTISLHNGERLLNTTDYIGGYLNNSNSCSIYVVNYSEYEERYELTINSSNNTLSSFNIYKTDDYGAGTRVNLGSIPISITLNGSANTTPSFYAPTTAGTNGYFLKSNGSGAPTWAQIPAGVTITLNGSATTTPSFYAPTEAGTALTNVLTWNTSLNRPSWSSGSLTDTKVTVAENTMATKYYPILATGTGTATRQIDTNDQVDSSADAVGLWYQNGILCAPALQIGDVDYAITTAEYEALMDAIDAI